MLCISSTLPAPTLAKSQKRNLLPSDNAHKHMYKIYRQGKASCNT